MKNLAINILLSFASTFFTLGAIELVTRTLDSEYRVENFLATIRAKNFERTPLTAHSKALGWSPMKNYSVFDENWQRQMTITAEGYRSNGLDASPIEASEFSGILAVGDSFTFGGIEVGDDETWPAYLEKLTGVQVLNGGVIGYGIDQTYLRARQLLTTYSPEILIFSFIPDDLRRVTVTINKPYFQLEKRRLVQKNTPVPNPLENWPRDEYFKSIFGYSYSLHKLLMTPKFRSRWVSWGGFSEPWTTSQNDKYLISCALIRALETLAAKKNIPLYILAQYTDIFSRPNYHARTTVTERLLDCISVPKYRIIDLKYSMSAHQLINPEENWNFYLRSETLLGANHHMTAAGNRFVAEKIYERLINN